MHLIKNETQILRAHPLNPIFLCVVLLLAAQEVFAEATSGFDIYGRVNLSYVFRDSNDDARNNASRIGVKGSLPVTDKMQMVYQIEQGVDLAHGGDELNNLLSTRNSFIGISGSHGTLFWGSHDTPLKKAQGQVDQFNDQQGDIASLFVGEVRARDAFGYTSPVWGGWQVFAMHVPADSHFDASQSVNVTYAQESWRFALGIDHAMRKNDRTVISTSVYDSVRASVGYKSGPWKLGFLAQQSEQINAPGADTETGYLISLGYTRGKTSLNAQRGLSDVINQNKSSTSIGLTHQWRKNFNTYVNYWRENDGELSIGFEVRL